MIEKITKEYYKLGAMYKLETFSGCLLFIYIGLESDKYGNTFLKFLRMQHFDGSMPYLMSAKDPYKMERVV